MTMRAGHYAFGPEQGRISIRTSRDGLAAQAGHDLTIDAVRWSGEFVVAPDLAPASLEVHIDLGALVVRTGTGGIKPLTDRDKREISVTARKVLATDRYPQASFTATGFSAAADGQDGTIDGTLTLAGQTRPQRLQVSQDAPGRFRVITTVRQTNFGIKPYAGFLGALKVSDAVEVDAEVDLSAITAVEPGR
ncbi:MAG TPA: YceI family protein [Streptosporangiaceae bacterium]|nr:YceI family protein [Streptosporangiaceae bacterium]